MNSTNPPPHKPNLAWIFSTSALGCAVFWAIIQIGLLIHHEVTNGRYGDGFMLPIPVLSWLFLVAPLCLVAGVLSIVDFSRRTRPGIWKQLLWNFGVIVLALSVEPLLLFYTLSEHAR